jgi:hypothetical protein
MKYYKIWVENISNNYKHQLQAIHMNYTWLSDVIGKHLLQSFTLHCQLHLSRKDGMKFPWTSASVMTSTKQQDVAHFQ